MSSPPDPLGHVRISHPHYSDDFGEHIDVDFVNPKRGYGQLILPFDRIHIDSPCQPDFDPTPGWEPGPDSGS